MRRQKAEGRRQKGNHGMTAGGLLLAVAAGCVLLTGCDRKGEPQSLRMWNDSRLKPMEPVGTPFGEAAARPIPVGTVARGQAFQESPEVTGRMNGTLVTRIPFAVTDQVLQRGQARFAIYCAPCHGRLGDGRGMIVQRSFPHPPDYALRRLKQAPVGHFYDVITNGYGVMYSYAARVPVNDRWAIAAYIRVIQSRRPTIEVDEFEAERQRARVAGIGTLPVQPPPGEHGGLADPHGTQGAPQGQNAPGAGMNAPGQNAPAPGGTGTPAGPSPTPQVQPMSPAVPGPETRPGAGQPGTGQPGATQPASPSPGH